HLLHDADDPHRSRQLPGGDAGRRGRLHYEADHPRGAGGPPEGRRADPGAARRADDAGRPAGNVQLLQADPRHRRRLDTARALCRGALSGAFQPRRVRGLLREVPETAGRGLIGAARFEPATSWSQNSCVEPLVLRVAPSYSETTASYWPLNSKTCRVP